MPTNIRAGLSVVVALLTLAVVYFESLDPASLMPWLAFGLGAAMLGAIWLFPEAKGTKD